jgi:hypothetical protein
MEHRVGPSDNLPVDAPKGGPLKLLPAYTGVGSLAAALHDPRAVRLLWLEILVNDRLDIGPWRDRAEVQAAHVKACRWFTTYRTLIEGLIRREPLPPDPGPIDPREYRTFAEALQFASDHP